MLTDLQNACESPAHWSPLLCGWCFPPQKKNPAAAGSAPAAAAAPPAGWTGQLLPEDEPAGAPRRKLRKQTQLELESVKLTHTPMYPRHTHTHTSGNFILNHML